MAAAATRPVALQATASLEAVCRMVVCTPHGSQFPQFSNFAFKALRNPKHDALPMCRRFKPSIRKLLRLEACGFSHPSRATPSNRMLYQNCTQPRRQKNALHTPCRQTGCEHRPSNGSSFSRPSRATPSKRISRGMRILSS